MIRRYVNIFFAIASLLFILFFLYEFALAWTDNLPRWLDLKKPIVAIANISSLVVSNFCLTWLLSKYIYESEAYIKFSSKNKFITVIINIVVVAVVVAAVLLIVSLLIYMLRSNRMIV